MRPNYIIDDSDRIEIFPNCLSFVCVALSPHIDTPLSSLRRSGRIDEPLTCSSSLGGLVFLEDALVALRCCWQCLRSSPRCSRALHHQVHQGQMVCGVVGTKLSSLSIVLDTAYFLPLLRPRELGVHQQDEVVRLHVGEHDKHPTFSRTAFSLFFSNFSSPLIVRQCCYILRVTAYHIQDVMHVLETMSDMRSNRGIEELRKSCDVVFIIAHFQEILGLKQNSLTVLLDQNLPLAQALPVFLLPSYSFTDPKILSLPRRLSQLSTTPRCNAAFFDERTNETDEYLY